MREYLAKDIMDLMRSYLDDSPDNNYTGNYVGVVENNKDPEKIGRCQVRIMGIHDDMPSENLQWAEPDFDLAAGHKGSFIVPEIGTTVNMYYNTGDVYQPRYFGKAIDKTTNDFTADKDEDYPDSVILYETRRGDYLKVNRFKGEFILHTAAGCTMRMSQNGDIDISNNSSNNGDMNLTLRGNFKVDNRRGNTTLITTNCSVSAFGSINVKSNESVEIDSLGPNTIKTNDDFEVIASNRAILKSQHGVRTETTKTETLSNTQTIAPSLLGPFEYGFCSNILQVPSLSVTPAVLGEGGPFNCIPYDPLTGMPHQGRIVSGESALTYDPIDKAAEIAKQTIKINAKYAQIISDATNEIVRKYASIDSQAQLVARSIGSTTITDSKELETAKATANITLQWKQEIADLQTEYNSFLISDIYSKEQAAYNAYKVSLKTDAVAIANVLGDITGKTTIKDELGSGKGLVNDD